MAPEYVVRGKLTEKADVYSFGVLVLELICGKTNNSACQNSLPILQTVPTSQHILSDFLFHLSYSLITPFRRI